MDLKLLGKTKVDGVSCYKIKTKIEGEPAFMFIDANKYLLAKTEITAREAGITATSEILVKSYRNIGGTKVPASVLIRLNGELMMTMNINRYKQNVEIADSQFAFPGR